jgi:hypothetical protein
VKPGLSEPELLEIEARYGVRFPPDLRSLLEVGVPVTRTKRGLFVWPDWATDDRRERSWIASNLAAPIDHILRAVEHEPWWWTAWGERPSSKAEGVRVAEAALRGAPRLVWLGGGGYLPFVPDASGNALFWINPNAGGEAYVVARNLTTLNWHNYGVEPPWPEDLPKRRPSIWDQGRFEEEAAAARWVPFWSELAAWNVKVGVPYTPTEPEVLRFFTWEEP